MTDSVFDPTEPAHAKALAMLEHDTIAWYTTVAADGSPRAVPVWFFWDGTDVFVSTRPDSYKVTALQAERPVLIHMNAGGPFGDDAVILHGRAEFAEETAAEWMARHRDAYLDKYAAAIEAFGSPIDDIVQSYSTVIRFRPTRVQAW